MGTGRVSPGATGGSSATCVAPWKDRLLDEALKSSASADTGDASRLVTSAVKCRSSFGPQAWASESAVVSDRSTVVARGWPLFGSTGVAQSAAASQW
jgi:hypothetical protein